MDKASDKTSDFQGLPATSLGDFRLCQNNDGGEGKTPTRKRYQGIVARTSLE